MHLLSLFRCPDILTSNQTKNLTAFTGGGTYLGSSLGAEYNFGILVGESAVDADPEREMGEKLARICLTLS